MCQAVAIVKRKLARLPVKVAVLTVNLINIQRYTSPLFTWLSCIITLNDVVNTYYIVHISILSNFTTKYIST